METPETKWMHRPPRTKDILRAKKLRETTDLSVREIGWALLHREDPKTVYRWLTSAVGESTKKLSTGNKKK